MGALLSTVGGWLVALLAFTAKVLLYSLAAWIIFCDVLDYTTNRHKETYKVTWGGIVAIVTIPALIAWAIWAIS